MAEVGNFCVHPRFIPADVGRKELTQKTPALGAVTSRQVNVGSRSWFILSIISWRKFILSPGNKHVDPDAAQAFSNKWRVKESHKSKILVSADMIAKV